MGQSSVKRFIRQYIMDNFSTGMIKGHGVTLYKLKKVISNLLI